MSQTTAAARVPTRPIARPTTRERPQPRLRVVAPAPRRSAGGLALLSVGLLGLGLLVLLLLNISIGKGAYALTELQSQQRQLAVQRQALAEQVEAASAPDRLAAQARKLGMVPNPSTVFVDVPNGTVQGKPEMATAPPKPAAKRQTARKTVGALVAAAAAGKQSVQNQSAAKSPDSKQSNGKRGAAGPKADPKTPADRTTAESSP
jgi:hypothetical protein